MCADNFLAITMKLKAVVLGWKWCSMKSKPQNPRSCTFLKAYVTPSIFLFLNGNDKEKDVLCCSFYLHLSSETTTYLKFSPCPNNLLHYYSNS